MRFTLTPARSWTGRLFVFCSVGVQTPVLTSGRCPGTTATRRTPSSRRRAPERGEGGAGASPPGGVMGAGPRGPAWVGARLTRAPPRLCLGAGPPRVGAGRGRGWRGPRPGACSGRGRAWRHAEPPRRAAPEAARAVGVRPPSPRALIWVPWPPTSGLRAAHPSRRLARGDGGDLGPPARRRWLRRGSAPRPTRAASVAPRPWPIAPAACSRAWTSWSSGARGGGRAGTELRARTGGRGRSGGQRGAGSARRPPTLRRPRAPGPRDPEQRR